MWQRLRTSWGIRSISITGFIITMLLLCSCFAVQAAPPIDDDVITEEELEDPRTDSVANVLGADPLHPIYSSKHRRNIARWYTGADENNLEFDEAGNPVLPVGECFDSSGLPPGVAVSVSFDVNPFPNETTGILGLSPGPGLQQFSVTATLAPPTSKKPAVQSGSTADTTKVASRTKPTKPVAGHNTTGGYEVPTSAAPSTTENAEIPEIAAVLGSSIATYSAEPSTHPGEARTTTLPYTGGPPSTVPPPDYVPSSPPPPPAYESTTAPSSAPYKEKRTTKSTPATAAPPNQIPQRNATISFGGGPRQTQKPKQNLSTAAHRQGVIQTTSAAPSGEEEQNGVQQGSFGSTPLPQSAEVDGTTVILGSVENGENLSNLSSGEILGPPSFEFVQINGSVTVSFGSERRTKPGTGIENKPELGPRTSTQLKSVNGTTNGTGIIENSGNSSLVSIDAHNASVLSPHLHNNTHAHNRTAQQQFTFVFGGQNESTTVASPSVPKSKNASIHSNGSSRILTATTKKQPDEIANGVSANATSEESSALRSELGLLANVTEIHEGEFIDADGKDNRTAELLTNATHDGQVTQVAPSRESTTHGVKGVVHLSSTTRHTSMFTHQNQRGLSREPVTLILPAPKLRSILKEFLANASIVYPSNETVTAVPFYNRFLNLFS